MVTYGPHGKIHESWWGATVPTTGPVGTANTWVGWRFTFSVPGRIAGYRIYVGSGVDGAFNAHLFDRNTALSISAVTFRPRSNLTGGVWHQAWVRPWVRVNTSADLLLGAMFLPGGYFRTNNALVGGAVTHNGITLIQGWQSTALFPFNTGLALNANANAIDVLFQAD